ncbi:MAG: SDR family NAD(P)-dependent oxidoreductase, partial [Ilumatobacter sp.]|nr:SDR family NAD(P)-dependent oxidoreductase [Ilumatobacter sp.]
MTDPNPSFFDAASTTDEVLIDIDLNGRVAAVTGASGGLGLETARSLAARGARVVLAARSEDDASAAG